MNLKTFGIRFLLNVSKITLLKKIFWKFEFVGNVLLGNKHVWIIAVRNKLEKNYFD